jgi:WD40 repeat protein
LLTEVKQRIYVTNSATSCLLNVYTCFQLYMEDYVLSLLISFQEITICLSAPCSSWSGTIKVWSMPQITRVATLKGHKERATDVAFSPADGFLATASAYDARPMMRGYFTKLVEYCIRYGYSSNTSGYVSGEYPKFL